MVLILFLSSHKFISSLSNIFSFDSLAITGYMFLLITSIMDDLPEPFGPINMTFSEYVIFKFKSLITSKPFLKNKKLLFLAIAIAIFIIVI